MTADEAIDLVAQDMHERKGWPVEECVRLVEIMRDSVEQNPQVFYDTYRRDVVRPYERNGI